MRIGVCLAAVATAVALSSSMAVETASGSLPRPAMVDGKVYLYQDATSGNNHYQMRIKIFGEGDADLVHNLAEDERTEPYAGISSMGCQVDVQGDSWGGWMFTQAYHPGENAAAQPNYGQHPGCGFDMTGAESLSFVAKGAKGGEQVEFFAGGLGWNPDTGAPSQPYPDSCAKVSLGVIELEEEYTRYTISLAGQDLSYLACGFGFVVSGVYNSEDVAFSLDEIALHFGPVAEPASEVPTEEASEAPPETPSVSQVVADSEVPTQAPPAAEEKEPGVSAAKITAIGGIIAAAVTAIVAAAVKIYLARRPKPGGETAAGTDDNSEKSDE